MRSRWLLPFKIALLLAVALAPGLAPGRPLAAQPADPASAPVARYRVAGVVTREQRSAISATGALIEAVGPDYVIVAATPPLRQRIAELGLLPQPLPRVLDFPPADTAYHNYAELVDTIHSVAATRPEIVRLFSIGRSYEARELWAAKISDNVHVDEDEPEALFVGHYHAREHLTVEMMLYILRMLVDEYGQPGHEEISDLVDSREVYLVFDLNPDGGEFDVATGSYRDWRKNRQPNTNSPCIGTDLNRNHSYRWGGLGASSDECFLTYRGPAPASAPEVAAIEAFVNSRVISDVQQIRVAITFHSYGELILWPYGYTYEDTPSDMPAQDQSIFVAIGQAMAALNGYRPQQASDLYITSGDFTDWAYGTHRIVAYTFEMYPRADPPGFYPPASVITAETERNRGAVLYLLQQAACPAASVEPGACGFGPSQPLLTWLPFASTN